ncbi:MAG: potassium channel protein [Hadesarchaea archaeon]|nr:potassium channel protein [Hadesarchaea archaeon]MDH5685871.1 potassium channel protein [Hadesarchaea archaeon]
MPESFKPKSVRELLTEMKDVSDLMIDLSYAAVLFENDELADRVHELETRMDSLMYQIRTIAAVVTRNVREARKITGILQVASAAEAISNATGDIADLVRMGIEIHPVARDALRTADEKIAWVEVGEGSVLVGKKFYELKLPSSIGIWIFAIKRGKLWIVLPQKDTEVRVGDALIVKGPPDGIAILFKMACIRREVWAPERRLPSIRKALAEMRDLSSLMVDMAYSSILFRSSEIAEEVMEAEEKFDKLSYKLWLATLKAAKWERNVARLNGLLQMVRSMEQISDAAVSIADVVTRRVGLHPVFSRALAEADEQIGRVNVAEHSNFVGKSLKELNLWTTMGAYVLMIKRGGRYMFDPSRRTRILAGDSLIIRGSQRGVQKVKKAAAG